MAYNCKYCALPNIAEIFAALKAGVPRTSVVSRFGLDPDKDYGPLGKCFKDHRPHDHAFEVSEGIKRNQKMLMKELRKSSPDRLAIKDLETRLASLRKEEREITALQTAENGGRGGNGETPLTIEALDRLLAESYAKGRSGVDNTPPLTSGEYLIHRRSKYGPPTAN